MRREQSVNLEIITVCTIIAGLLLTVYCLVRLGMSYRVVRRDLGRDEPRQDSAGDRDDGHGPRR
jgi:hypothetical protein